MVALRHKVGTNKEVTGINKVGEDKETGIIMVIVVQVDKKGIVLFNHLRMQVVVKVQLPVAKWHNNNRGLITLIMHSGVIIMDNIHKIGAHL